MRAKEFLREASQSVAFCFGRLNPPTIGHKALMDATASADSSYKIFVSQTQDKKDNPLDYETKIKFIKAMFPEHAKHVVVDRNLNTIMKIAVSLYEEGFRTVTLVAGSDRLESFKKLLTDYNGAEGKSHGFYKFDNLNFVSSGEREDGAEGVAGVSASGARAAAKTGDKAAFAEATGAGKLTDELYNAVRAGLGINEHIVKVKGGYELKSKHGNKNLGKYPTRAGAEKRERQVQYFKHAHEDAAGVGIVTKQNSTQDVGPGTIKKNLKAFNLVGNKK